jgi:hypothetical protein
LDLLVLDLRVGMGYLVGASPEVVAGRGGLRSWALVGRALEDDYVEAVEGYGVGGGLGAVCEDVCKG